MCKFDLDGSLIIHENKTQERLILQNPKKAIHNPIFFDFPVPKDRDIREKIMDLINKKTNYKYKFENVDFWFRFH